MAKRNKHSAKKNSTQIGRKAQQLLHEREPSAEENTRQAHPDRPDLSRSTWSSALLWFCFLIGLMGIAFFIRYHQSPNKYREETLTFRENLPYPPFWICQKGENPVGFSLIAPGQNLSHPDLQYEISLSSWAVTGKTTLGPHHPFPKCKEYSILRRGSEKLYTPEKRRHNFILSGNAEALISFSASNTTLTQLSPGQSQVFIIESADGAAPSENDPLFETTRRNVEYSDSKQWEAEFHWKDYAKLDVAVNEKSLVHLGSWQAITVDLMPLCSSLFALLSQFIFPALNEQLKAAIVVLLGILLVIFNSLSLPSEPLSAISSVVS